MKKIFSLVLVCLSLQALEAARAQTAADFYMPMQVGNYLQFHTSQGPSGWAARTTTYTFEGTDTIAGKAYLRERGREIADNQSFDDTFLLRWLGTDSGGNVMIAAVGEESSDLDSAFILPVPGPLLANAALVPGYSTRYPYSNYFMVDSTISDSETVTSPAGTFDNCIMRSETHYDSAGNTIFLEYHYFARGVGMVLNVRTIPQEDAHTDQLVEIHTVTSVDRRTGGPGSFTLLQNYPNPFNPATVIRYQISAVGRVSLKVFDVLGREVTTLVDRVESSGEHAATFDGARYPSGVYFYTLQSNNTRQTGKMILLK